MPSADSSAMHGGDAQLMDDCFAFHPEDRPTPSKCCRILRDQLVRSSALQTTVSGTGSDMLHRRCQEEAAPLDRLRSELPVWAMLLAQPPAPQQDPGLM